MKIYLAGGVHEKWQLRMKRVLVTYYYQFDCLYVLDRVGPMKDKPKSLKRRVKK